MPPDGLANCFLNSLIILFSSAQSFVLTFDRRLNGLLLLKPAPRLLLRDLLPRCLFLRDLLRLLLLDLLFFIYI